MNQRILLNVVLYFTLLFCFVAPVFVYAQIKITEIMYDLSGTDTNREWVEIFNDGQNDVQIITGSSKGSWRFVDNSAHILTPYTDSESTIGPFEYAIITKSGGDFMSEWSSFDGLLFTSPLSLTNTGSTISIKDGDGNVLDSVTYNSDQGANGDGNSLQKNSSGNWIASTPTPGTSNNVSNSSGDVLGVSTQSSSGSSSTNYGSSASTASGSQGVLDVFAGGDRTTSTGSPISFQAVVKKNTVQNSGLKFSWSFGDGNVGNGQTVTHTYKYPGEYAVVLSSRAGSFLSTIRFKVKVVDAEIIISRTDEYIEIENKTNYEINLFNWKLISRNMGFIFQPDTIILPRSSIRLPAELLTIKGENESDTLLKNSIGYTLAEYIEPINEEDKLQMRETLERAYDDVVSIQKSIESKTNINFSDQSKKEVLGSSVSKYNIAGVSGTQEDFSDSVDPSEDLGDVKFESSTETDVQQSLLSKIISFFKSVID